MPSKCVAFKVNSNTFKVNSNTFKAKTNTFKAGVNPNRSEIWSIIKRELLGLK